MKEYMIGTILEDGTKVKGIGNGGFEYFLDPNAFSKKEGVCYIDEHDCEYEYEDFITLTKGNHELAEHYLDIVSGTSPELLLGEDLNNDEVHNCSKCDKLYFSYEVDNCPYCGHKKIL